MATVVSSLGNVYNFDSTSNVGTTGSFSTVLSTGNNTGSNNIVVQQSLIMPVGQPAGTTNLLNITSGASVPTAVGVPLGAMYFNTTNNMVYIYGSTGWTSSVTSSETLAATLAAGNTTGGHTIIFTTGDTIKYISGIAIGGNNVAATSTSATSGAIGPAASDGGFANSLALFGTATSANQLMLGGTSHTVTVPGGLQMTTPVLTTATTGMLTINSTPGIPTGAAPNGTVVYNSANNVFYLRQGGAWVADGTGTVTSVGLSAPSEFTVSGSPVNGAGTLTFTKANQTANLVYAGPSSGGAAAPTFRALVAADIPAGTGIQTLAQVLTTGNVTGSTTIAVQSSLSSNITFDEGIVINSLGTLSHTEIKIGFNSAANSSFCTALGANTNAGNNGVGTALGSGCVITNAVPNCTAVGGNVTITAGGKGVGVGNLVAISGLNACGVGSDTTISGANSSAFGYGNVVSGATSFVGGKSNTVAAANNVVIGNNISITGAGTTNNVIVGNAALNTAGGSYNVVVGDGAKGGATGGNTALGAGATTGDTQIGQTAVGEFSNTNDKVYSACFGHFAQCDDNSQIGLGGPVFKQNTKCWGNIWTTQYFQSGLQLSAAVGIDPSVGPSYVATQNATTTIPAPSTFYDDATTPLKSGNTLLLPVVSQVWTASANVSGTYTNGAGTSILVQLMWFDPVTATNKEIAAQTFNPTNASNNFAISVATSMKSNTLTTGYIFCQITTPLAPAQFTVTRYRFAVCRSA